MWASSKADVAYALMKPVGEQVLVIDPRFCGPPDAGNGGYVCGLLAAFLGGSVEVTLRRPPPIGRPLLSRATEGGLALLDGDELVAKSVPARLELNVPNPVHSSDARKAARSYPGFARHPFPTCFVCSPQREEDDGLRICPGPVTGRNVVAAPWTPGQTLANGEAWSGRSSCGPPSTAPGRLPTGSPRSRWCSGAWRWSSYVQFPPVNHSW